MEDVFGRRDSEVSPNFIRAMVLGFFFSGLLLMVNHEMWCDEMQAWLIAKDSHSMVELFRNLRYEGHPGLWHLGLYLLSRLSSQPLVMQMFHLLLATGTVYIFTKFSPFTRLHKVLFIFGYFPFFEYAVISRNYSMGILLIFSFCAMFQAPLTRRYILLSGILFLLCQTSVYGLIIAFMLGLMLMFDISLRYDLQHNLLRFRYQLAISLAIFLTGITVAVVQIIPPADSGFALGWNFAVDMPHMLNVFATVWRSYVPIPDLKYNFWGTNIITNSYLSSLLSISLLVFSVLLFVRQPAVLFLYCLGTLGLLSFTYVKYFGSIRHHGHLYVLLITCLWLSFYYPDRELKSRFISKISDFCEKNRDKFIIAIFSVHLVAGGMAYVSDLLYPFSGSREIAQYIKDNKMENMLMVGDEDDAASAVSGYLDRKIFYLSNNRFGSFVILDRSRQPVNPEEVIKKVREIMKRQETEILLILNYKLNIPEITLAPIKKIDNSIVPTENYYIYLLDSKKFK